MSSATEAEEEGEEEAEDKDYYTAENIFWVPQKARWHNLQNNAKKPEIGKIIERRFNHNKSSGKSPEE